MANHTKGKAPPNKTVAPADDKVFGEKVRKTKGKKEKGPVLSIDRYNECYDAYMTRQSAAYVAKTVGIDRRTAKRVIEEGYPKRNLRPLKMRYQSVIQGAQQKQDYNLAMARAEVQGAARALLIRVGERIRFLDPDEIDANRLSNILKDLQVTIERTLGVADASVDVRAEGRFVHWSIQELMIFAATGTAPEHDRSIAPVSSVSYKTKDG